MPSRAALTQPQAAIASAIPTWPCVRNSRTAATADTASPASAVSIGVRVSSCANDTDASTFSSAWPGMPSAIAATRAGDRRGVARAEGAALEQSRDDRLGQQRQPDRRRQREAERDLEGARLRRRRDAARSSARTCAAMAGVITEAMATDTTPSGSS